jgi:hypothetical protein
VDSINLGAVLFALLLLVWISIALPQTVRRRDVMGTARAAEKKRSTTVARDLSAAARERPRNHEVTAMSKDRLLLRSADPTKRPRFESEPLVTVDPLADRHRHQHLMVGVMAGLAVLTIVWGVLVALTPLPVGTVLIPAVALALYVVGLRRAELDRRERARRAARFRRAEADGEATDRTAARDASAASPAGRGGSGTDAAATSAADPSAPAGGTAPRNEGLGEQIEHAAQDVIAAGEWLPRPVPRPTYAMRGEVEDLATRHEEHRRSVAPGGVPLETEDSEGDAALQETVASTAEVPEGPDLQLDEILRRRRA